MDYKKCAGCGVDIINHGGGWLHEGQPKGKELVRRYLYCGQPEVPKMTVEEIRSAERARL